MQAIRVHHCGGPEVLVLDTLPTPVPGPGQALVRVLAAGAVLPPPCPRDLPFGPPFSVRS